MVETRLSLESNFRLERIRSIKQYAFVVQWIIFLLLAVFIIYKEGLTTDPLYIPLNATISYICIISTVMIGEGIFFKLMEMNNEHSFSSKFLIARKASQSSLIYLIIAIIVVVIFVTPPIVGVMEGMATETGEMWSGDSNSFSTQTTTGIMDLKGITVSIPSGEAEVFVLTDIDYTLSGFVETEMRVRNLAGSYIVTPEAPLELDFESMPLQNLWIIVQDASGVVEYELEYSMTGTFTMIIPLLMVATAVVSLAWYIILIPMKKKFRSLSIYA